MNTRPDLSIHLVGPAAVANDVSSIESDQVLIVLVDRHVAVSQVDGIFLSLL
jgi:hypothetical protein